MFTGIIKAIGAVAIDEPALNGLVIRSPLFAERPPALGASVAVDGVCLTVSGTLDNALKFDLGAETCAVTVLDQLKAGQQVNLELALRLGDPLDGHLVQGHIDGLVTLENSEMAEDFCTMTFSFPEALSPLIVKKGSVAINGVSLTVNNVTGTTFSVGLIPHTIANTCLTSLKRGQQAHIETDILGRYVVALATKGRPA